MDSLSEIVARLQAVLNQPKPLDGVQFVPSWMVSTPQGLQERWPDGLPGGQPSSSSGDNGSRGGQPSSSSAGDSGSGDSGFGGWSSGWQGGWGGSDSGGASGDGWDGSGSWDGGASGHGWDGGASGHSWDGGASGDGSDGGGSWGGGGASGDGWDGGWSWGSHNGGSGGASDGGWDAGSWGKGCSKGMDSSGDDWGEELPGSQGGEGGKGCGKARLWSAAADAGGSGSSSRKRPKLGLYSEWQRHRVKALEFARMLQNTDAWYKAWLRANPRAFNEDFEEVQPLVVPIFKGKGKYIAPVFDIASAFRF